MEPNSNVAVYLSAPMSAKSEIRIPAAGSAADELRGLKSRKFDDEAVSASVGAILRRLPAQLRQIVALAWEASRRGSIAVLALQVASGAAAAFALLAARHVLAEILAAAPTADRTGAILPQMAVMAAAFVLRGALDSGAAHVMSVLIPRVRRITQERMCRATAETELATFDDPAWQEVVWRARERGLSCAPMAVDQLAELAGALVRLGAATAVLVVLHPVLLPLLICAVAPKGWATLRSARMRHASELAGTTLNRRLRIFSDLLTGPDTAAEVRACTAREALLAEYRRLASTAETEETGLRRDQARVATTGRALGGLGTAATYLALWLLVFTGAMPLAAAGIAVIAIRTGQTALDRTIMATNKVFVYGLYVEEYVAFIRESTERSYLRPGPPAPGGFEEIRVRNVTFSYPAKEQPVLREISLTIRRGQVVALVGENGSGKSTLAKLLAGLYQPQHGTICWDGVDIAGMDQHSLHERIAVVMQQPARWPMSARANITIGRSDRVDPDQVATVQAAREADVHGLIEALPYGYDTILSNRFEGGTDLSGGQWQRIAVARGHFRDAPLLLFDEPTAALDARAEARVFRSIQQLADKRTVVLITHRLASVRHCDRIFVLRGGRLVEEGTHDELVAANREYADMYAMQKQAFAT